MSLPQLSGDESTIAQNLGSLEGYLGNRQYTTAQVALQGDLGNESIVRNPTLGPVTQPGTADYAPQGAAPQPQQPGVSLEHFNAMVAYAQQQEQANRALAQQAIQAEEAQFLAQLDYAVEMGQMTDSQRDVQIVLRRNQQLEQSQQHVVKSYQELQDAQEEQEQEDAKYRLGRALATQAGLNWFDTDVYDEIMRAETRDDMDRSIRLLTRGVQPGSSQPVAQHPTQAQVAAGVFAAAGGAGGGTAPAQVKKGSGDLGRYIKAKGGYQAVAVE